MDKETMAKRFRNWLILLRYSRNPIKIAMHYAICCLIGSSVFLAVYCCLIIPLGLGVVWLINHFKSSLASLVELFHIDAAHAMLWPLGLIILGFMGFVIAGITSTIITDRDKK